MRSATSRRDYSRSPCRSRIWRTTGSKSVIPARTARPTATPSPTPIASCPRSARWTCTCLPRVAMSVCGTSFAVWAPNAKGVSLIGEFNHWDGNEAQLRVLGSTGVWELFWPGFEVGGLYKFRVHGADGSVTDRADPMAFATEVPPQTASKVTRSSYTWGDHDWMNLRTRQNPVFEPMSTYEVHLMSWRP